MSNQLAFLFPGQGSQTVGMLKDFWTETTFRKVFDEASDTLSWDLLSLIQTGPEEELNKTALAQPVLLASSIALWQIWLERHGKMPVLMAGHSLGEYSALVASGVFNFADALRLVALRGELMQSAVPSGVGAMAAIVGLSEEQVREICRTCAEEQVLSPANFNNASQIVVAGNVSAVQRAMEAAKEAGAKLAKLLPVSVPSHCALMEPAAEKFAQALEKVSLASPKIPIIHNFDLEIYKAPEKIRAALVQQLCSPVRWAETIQKMSLIGIKVYIECGPNKVLTGLNKRMAENLTLPIGDFSGLGLALRDS